MALSTRSIIVTGALALCAAHCGGTSTPASNTPEASSESTAGPDPTGSQQFSESSGDSADPTRSTAAALTDPQIAAITDKINTAEIEQAQVAQSKSNNDQVRRFAEMMLEHHGQAKSQQSSLGLGSAESPLSIQLEQDAKATLETLKAKSGTEFDRAYLQGQVEGHQKALDTIQRIRQSAQNPELRSYLDKLTPQVEKHLEEARSAQQTLQSMGSTPGATTGMR